ncbi:twin-arginine translocase TatA/TatE family subunit [Actinacidiphila oryziradicis]|uniref:twin-arginine translocase TatA/TatE family subunit n=1 Tax=Actinacidiphila oryziradicis TaxID=2571141 RepID=UPI001FEA97B6|nr:twin-arginine translocase TatA/TatE family subunit [Actinacidiphila oryziradicis]
MIVPGGDLPAERQACYIAQVCDPRPEGATPAGPYLVRSAQRARFPEWSPKVFFDLSPFKLLTLMILATVAFGPDKLPEMVSRAMGLLRTVRAFAENAKQDIRKELGPEFKNSNSRTSIRAPS